jgi:hypothetical protein
MTWCVNVARHDANLALTWLDNARAVRSNETSLVLALKEGLHSDHIQSRDTFSNADN